MNFRTFFCCSVGLILCAAGWQVCNAQTVPAGGDNGTITVSQQQIDELRKRADSDSQLDETVKEMVTELLTDATVDLQSSTTLSSEASAFQKDVDTAEQELEAASESITQPSDEVETSIAENESAASLQQRLVEAQAALTAAEERAVSAASEPSRRQTRLLAIPDEQAKIEAELAGIRTQLAATATTNEDPLLTEARTLRLQSQLLAGEAKLQRLKKESAAYAATAPLLPLQRQLAERKADQLRRQITDLQEALAALGQAQIDTLRERVKEAKAIASPELYQSLIDNLDRYESIAARSAEVRDKLSEMRKRLEEVKAREKTTMERVDAVGLTDALAFLLQREKEELSDYRSQYRPDPTLKAEIRQLQVEAFQLEDQSNGSVETGVSNAPGGVDGQSTVQDDVLPQDLIKLRNEILSKLVPASATLFQELVSLDTTQRLLQEAIDRYLEFIEGNLLWTRNAPLVTSTDPSAALNGLAWLISPANWAEVPREFARRFMGSPILVLLLLALFSVLCVWRPRWRRGLKAHAEIARRRNCVVIEPTVRASILTLLMTAPIPCLLAGVGWLSAASKVSGQFPAAFGWGLLCAAAFVLPFVFLCQLCRASGLAIDHFGWSEQTCKSLRHAGRDIASSCGPLVLVAEMLHVKNDAAVMDSLGRYVLLILMVVFLFQIHLVLRPGRFSKQPADASFWYRKSKLIYALAMQIPLAIAVLISLGYEYMTFAVMSHLLATLSVMLVIVVLRSIATRALLVRRRRLTIAQYRQRREAIGDSELAESAGIDLTSAEVDLGSISDQAHQSVRLLTLTATIVALSIIWNDLLPALTMLDRVTLWSTGTTTVNLVTLSDLFFAILSIAVTVYAVKSGPALIELFFLQPLGPGARYAVSTICRYVIGSIGLVFGLSFLSIPWSQLSWILAAASVGLGFGLQEILANFVSGIILLLEQPIRVGDIVTIDGSTGVVSKMQIRATTVTNWDRQELVIPNKDLVTGKLLNWTLSNVINRVVVNVGVAYGSDPNKVREVLMRVVHGHPEVLDDPVPLVTFEQFGDSSLNFVIRCYLPSLEKRLATIHELHAGIAEALRAANVEIPFPQRDVHMTIEPAGAVIDGVNRVINEPAR